MNLLVINPPVPADDQWAAKASWYLREENHAAPDSTPMPPHFLPAILGQVRQRLGKDLKVKILDGLLEPFDQETAREIARKFKADAALVMASVDFIAHDCSFAQLPCPSFVQICPVTADPREACGLYPLKGDYFLFGGESEASLAEALLELRDCGRVVQAPGLIRRGPDGAMSLSSPPKVDQATLAPPAYDLLPMSAYLECQIRWEPDPRRHESALIKSMKGCLFSCIFCTCSSEGQRARYKSPEQVLAEMNLLKNEHGISRFVFLDPEFGVNLPRAKDICRGIIQGRLNISFLICNRVDLVDDELLGLLARAGCEGVRYGIESADPDVQKLINKKIDLERAKKAIAATSRAGLKVNLFFMLGLPGETAKTIDLNARFILDTQADSYSLGRVFLIPNTSLYQTMQHEGRLLERDWQHYRRADTYQFRHDYYPDLKSLQRAERRLSSVINRKRLSSYRKGPLNLRLFLFLGSFDFFTQRFKENFPRAYQRCRSFTLRLFGLK
jgi:radical SAM superfamily enzyme YgiQ (UPF0313 family)